MAKAYVLKPESEEDRHPFTLIRDSDIYVGMSIRIRELFANGLEAPAMAGKRMRTIAMKAERIVIASVTRVMTGTDGHTYVVADVTTGHPSLKSTRIRHRVGSGKMAARKDIVKEITFDPSTGPTADERLAERPVDHSRRIRRARFDELLQKALAGGVSASLFWEVLGQVGDDYAHSMFEKNAEKLVSSGKPAPERPQNLGDAEFAAVRAVRDLGREPEYWMFPVVQDAADDPAAFIAQYEWRDAA